MGFKFNPLSKVGLDIAGADTLTAINFSYINVLNTEDITVNSGQQMVVVGPVLVDGQLNLDGEMVLDDIKNKSREGNAS